MHMKTVTTHRFVKGEDLNHHGTLFAARTAEWFVESGLMSAAAYLPADNIVCVRLHDMSFKKPVKLGQILRLDSAVVYAGKSSLISRIKGTVNEETIIEGFISFVNVDENGKAFPHGIKLTPETDEERLLWEKAAALKNKNS